MIVDDAGALWLSNPWLVLSVLVLAVGLIVWCHRWLETGEAPLPRNAAVRTRGIQPRRLRTKVQPQSLPMATASRFSAGSRIAARTHRTARLPRTAA